MRRLPKLENLRLQLLNKLIYANLHLNRMLEESGGKLVNKKDCGKVNVYLFIDSSEFTPA